MPTTEENEMMGVSALKPRPSVLKPEDGSFGSENLQFAPYSHPSPGTPPLRDPQTGEGEGYGLRVKG
jgi:hypothetical protein